MRRICGYHLDTSPDGSRPVQCIGCGERHYFNEEQRCLMFNIVVEDFKVFIANARKEVRTGNKFIANCKRFWLEDFQKGEMFNA